MNPARAMPAHNEIPVSEAVHAELCTLAAGDKSSFNQRLKSLGLSIGARERLKLDILMGKRVQQAEQPRDEEGWVTEIGHEGHHHSHHHHYHHHQEQHQQQQQQQPPQQQQPLDTSDRPPSPNGPLQVYPKPTSSAASGPASAPVAQRSTANILAQCGSSVTPRCSLLSCTEAAHLVCTGCRMVRYCCQAHQKQAWKSHRRECKEVQGVAKGDAHSLSEVPGSTTGSDAQRLGAAPGVPPVPTSSRAGFAKIWGRIESGLKIQLGSPTPQSANAVPALAPHGAWLCVSATLPSQNTVWTCGYENLAALYQTLIRSSIWPSVPAEVAEIARKIGPLPMATIRKMQQHIDASWCTAPEHAAAHRRLIVYCTRASSSTSTPHDVLHQSMQ